MQNEAMGSQEELTLNQQLEEIDQEIEMFKRTKEFHESLLALKENEDFNRVITEGYFGEEKERLVSLMVEPLSPASPEDFKEYVSRIDGIRHLASWIEFAYRRSRDMDAKIDAAQEFRKSVTAEHAEKVAE